MMWSRKTSEQRWQYAGPPYPSVCHHRPCFCVVRDTALGRTRRVFRPGSAPTDSSYTAGQKGQTGADVLSSGWCGAGWCGAPLRAAAGLWIQPSLYWRFSSPRATAEVLASSGSAPVLFQPPHPCVVGASCDCAARGCLPYSSSDGLDVSSVPLPLDCLRAPALLAPGRAPPAEAERAVA